MSILKKIYRKLYFRYGNTLLGKTCCPLPSQMDGKKNLFIYFDYEREFGGHDTQITDKDIDLLLRLLDEYQLKTTWFTVGKIFEFYPDSIHAILSHGHEIGSHTYGHIAPFKQPIGAMKEDFESFNEASKNFTEVKGFHSPNGLWSLSMFSQLQKYGYNYDVFRLPAGTNQNPYIAYFSYRRKILRLPTLGDDWNLYKKKSNATDVCIYLQNMTAKMKYGNIAGIGFHPWILFSDMQIFEGFKNFLFTLSQNTEFEIKPALDFVRQIVNKTD